jgi:hypothetical protein
MASGIFIVGIGGILTIIGFANLKSQTGSLLSLIQLVAGVFFDHAVLGVTLPVGTIEGCLLVLIASVIVSFNDSANPFVKYNGCVKIVEDCYKNLLRAIRWVLPLQTRTVRNKK